MWGRRCGNLNKVVNVRSKKMSSYGMISKCYWHYRKLKDGSYIVIEKS